MKKESPTTIELKNSMEVLPLYVLRSRLISGNIASQDKSVIEEVIKEKEARPNVDNKTNSIFYNGQNSSSVLFALNDYVKIISGVEKGKSGSVISLVTLVPEPIYNIEIDGDDGDREIPQSSLRISE